MICQEELELIFKSSNGNPSCVTPETAQKLSSEMQSLSENSLDMIVRVDQVGNVYYANPMTESFIGITSEKINGKNINNVELNPEIVTFFKEIINKTNIAGEEIQEETIFSTITQL